ncbi:MAG: hypothetical protein KatS3mg085_627 [Candidatus Dojkabacteria bacterium]|nr:MAG: hypothetical protein KatS3mg085_627 [Candidatus Dojkabacteria bacterium]
MIDFIPQATLDYHKFGKLLPYDIEKILFEFIEDSYYSNYQKILIITGKGKVVRPLVKRLLAQNKFVSNFKQASYFNGQSGAFEVTLIS